MNYETSTHQVKLLHDLADGIIGTQALDQAVCVLVEWGFIDAEFASEYIKEIESSEKIKKEEDQQESPARLGRADSIQSGARVGEKYFPT